jgi:hypothetical protein
MHPEVNSQHGGDCPVCGMALEALQTAASAPDTAASAADSAASRSSVKPVVQHVFSQAIEAPAWLDEKGQVQALFYNDELPVLADEEPFARFGGRGERQLTLSRTSEPPEPWDEATSRVAFQLRDAAKAPPVHSVGRVVLPAGRRSALVVPEDALLALDNGPYVLVRDAEAQGFEPRRLGIGKTQYDMVTVANGLVGHEPVVVRNAFVLDAERRLRAGLGSMP